MDSVRTEIRQMRFVYGEMVAGFCKDIASRSRNFILKNNGNHYPLYHYRVRKRLTDEFVSGKGRVGDYMPSLRPTT